MKTINFIFIILSFIILTSCATQRLVLTKDFINQNDLKFEDLKKLQYFSKNAITIDRKVSSDYDISTGTHKLITKFGEKYEIINIRDKTPGICERVYKRNDGKIGLMISFEPNISVEFAEGSNGAFSMCYYTEKGSGFVKYGDYVYNYPKSLYLSIDKASIRKITYERRTVKGRRLDE